MSVLKAAASCRRQAADAESQAAQITDQHLKAIYLRIADHWSALARSYEFADSAEYFLLDAKQTKHASSQEQRVGFDPPSSLACRAADLLLKRHSDRCCLRLVPEEPTSDPKAVAA